MSNRRCSEQEEQQLAEDVMQAVLDGTPLKDLQGISADQMDSLYGFAYEFYEQGRLDDAERFFHFLCIYDLAAAKTECNT